MKKLKTNIRDNWQKININAGLQFGPSDGKQYWNEGFYYEFSEDEINEIKEASNELYQMCLNAVDNVIMYDRFNEIGINKPWEKELIIKSRNKKDFSIYGRFDLMYDGKNPPKFLEYNAQTPTSLIEASIISKVWKDQLFPESGQFNNIESSLINNWKKFKSSKIFFSSATFDFKTGITLEEISNVTYLGYTASKAGKDSYFIPNEMLEIDYENKKLKVKNSDIIINDIFLHIPSEYYINKELEFFVNSDVTIIEPFWKIILHSKAISKVLWEMYPNHKNLIPTYDNPNGMINYVKKPIFSQEGENIEIYKNGQLIENNNKSNNGLSYIYQEFVEGPNFDGWVPNIGSWIIGNSCEGIGIREEKGLIIKSWSCHTPHIVKISPKK